MYQTQKNKKPDRKSAKRGKHYLESQKNHILQLSCCFTSSLFFNLLLSGNNLPNINEKKKS